jgi:hydroxypyruvate reductase
MPDRRALLRAMFDAAVAAASPSLCVPPHLPAPPSGRTIVIGAGKAGASMAAAVEANWPGKLEGLVVTRYGHAVPCERIEIVEAAHPVPDEAGRDAAQRILALAESAGPDDLVLCLISGGGSALLALPATGLTLEDKQDVNRQLLMSGATISEINCVRKHLSAIKGGRLAAAAAPARVVTLIISDVPGDDPATVASGPTVGDPTTSSNAIAILDHYAIKLPPAIAVHLSGPGAETPKPNDPIFERVHNIVVASASGSLTAAATVAKEAGFTPRILGDAIEGESRIVGAEQAALAVEAAGSGEALISGGETTVTVAASGGRGGRNSEYLLALALALEGMPGISALAADTDGIDGSEDNAGAFAFAETLARARDKGVEPAERLAANDAYTVFEAAGDLLVSGPTFTNVNDFRAILIERD